MGFKFLNILKTIITENSSDGDVNVEFNFRDIKPWIKYPMNRIYFNNLSLKSGMFGSDTENIALISNDGEVYKFDIDDFNYKYGEPKIVFTKGTPDLKISCPALVIDPNTNSLLIYIDTYGTKEIIPISNIPAKKWLHVGIVVDQYSTNIYINGTLHTHHTLNQLPKQNSANVLITPKGGFNGKVGSIDYYPTLLDQNDIYNLSLNTPKLDRSSIGIVPPYFAQTWWLQKS